MCKKIVIAFLLWTASALAADWDSCEDDLDRLRRRASDASDAASTVRDMADDLRQKRDELQQCLSYPQAFDLLQDNCQSLRWEYENARSSYESAMSDLEGNLDDISSTLRSIEYSCGYAFGAGASGRKSTGDSFCRLLQRYKATVSAATLLQICMKSKSEADCKKCLQ
jgi:hypothetical protein